MQITIGNSNPNDEMIEVVVRYHEVINELGQSAQLNVRVANVDSRAAIEKAAYEAAHKFLERALLAHNA